MGSLGVVGDVGETGLSLENKQSRSLVIGSITVF